MKKNELNELIFNYFLINITIVPLLLFYVFMIITFINPFELELWHLAVVVLSVVGLIMYGISCIKDAISCWKSYSKEIKEYIKDNR